jgi:hypothetical protein
MEENMRINLRYGFILWVVIIGLVTIPSCAKKQVQTEAPVVQEQEQEMTSEEIQAAEQERLAREAAEGELRAEKSNLCMKTSTSKKGVTA